MIEGLLALVSGFTVALCIASFWLVIQLPSRVLDVSDAGGTKTYALALLLGCVWASVNKNISLPAWLGCACFVPMGVFVGMLASALTEVLEVVPALYDRLSVTSDMRWAALAMTLGKTAGAFLGCALKY